MLKLLWLQLHEAYLSLRPHSGDWLCHNFHALEYEGKGRWLCTCGREWRGGCCISRNWKAEMDQLAEEIHEEG